MIINSFFTREEKQALAEVLSKKFVVGIDPGVSTGFCLYDKVTKKIFKLATLDFWELFDALEEIKTWIGAEHISFFIENSALNKPTFSKAGGTTQKKIQKISRNVGSNQRESTLLIEGIRRYGFHVVEIKPTGIRGVKRKWDEDYFKKITGYTHRSSQHARDAAMLVFGK